MMALSEKEKAIAMKMIVKNETEDDSTVEYELGRCEDDDGTSNRRASILKFESPSSLPSRSIASFSKRGRGGSTSKSTKYKPTIRTFLNSWKVNREWLQYEEGFMFCNICRQYREYEPSKAISGKNTFIAGSKNFKLEAVKDHEISKFHRKACLRQHNEQKNVFQTPAQAAGMILSCSI